MAVILSRRMHTDFVPTIDIVIEHCLFNQESAVLKGDTDQSAL